MSAGSFLKSVTKVFTIKRASIPIYEACTDQLVIQSYFDAFKLKDTFYSFFLVVQLHVWMCQARSMKEGSDGRKLRNEIVARMWIDIERRMNRLILLPSKEKKSVLLDLLYHHQGAMFSYDEGLLTDDKTLACALWRTLFSKDDVDPEVLELAVKYVRTQMGHIRSINSTDWCYNGRFEWSAHPPFKTRASIFPSLKIEA